MDLKKYLPYLLTAGVGVWGAFNQYIGDKKTEELVTKAATLATKLEFDKLARSKHGGPRHPGCRK